MSGLCLVDVWSQFLWISHKCPLAEEPKAQFITVYGNVPLTSDN